ncbi:hypothetical protein TSMEX_003888 [Taenia solium]|eukprot:TsM_000556300 transcript=TsM_000556300 gene=TsM_000556300
MTSRKVKVKIPSEVLQKRNRFRGQTSRERKPSRVTLAPGASEAILRFSLRKSFTQDQIDVGYPGSYANEVFKAARSQQDGEAVFDITKYLRSLDEEREITTRLLLPLPNIILTILHYSLPLLLFLQFLTFLAIFVVMQGDDCWLRGWVIRGVSIERGWSNGSRVEQEPLTRLVPIMQEHVHLRGHLWYAWNLMVLIHLPLAISHAIFVLDGKSEGLPKSETAVRGKEERKLPYKPTQGDVIPDLEELTKEVETAAQSQALKEKENNKKGKGEGGGNDNATQLESARAKSQNLLHRYKVKRPHQWFTLLLLVVTLTLLSYSSYVISRK